MLFVVLANVRLQDVKMFVGDTEVKLTHEKPTDVIPTPYAIVLRCIDGVLNCVFVTNRKFTHC